MRALEREGSVLPGGDGLVFDPAPQGVLISGRVQCAGSIMIDVAKRLTVLSGEGEMAIVQTVAYTYHAVVEDVGNLFRYCGPHADHNQFHHKHQYDVLSGDVEGTVIQVEADARPTLAEVIREACAWYYAHAEEVEARRGSK
jgi:hypothetical protein